MCLQPARHHFTSDKVKTLDDMEHFGYVSDDEDDDEGSDDDEADGTPSRPVQGSQLNTALNQWRPQPQPQQPQRTSAGPKCHSANALLMPPQRRVGTCWTRARARISPLPRTF